MAAALAYGPERRRDGLTRKAETPPTVAASPVARNPFDLDVLPTPAQRNLLRAIAAGGSLVEGLDGRPVLLPSGRGINPNTVRALVNRQWIDRLPGLPLFHATPKLTRRGLHALARAGG